MQKRSWRAGTFLTSILLLCSLAVQADAQDRDTHRLVAAMLADTPLEEDLKSLVDEVGGRATGTEANSQSVEWALARFHAAGVDAKKEAFTMPGLWLEVASEAKITGDDLLSPRVVAKPFSTTTRAEGITAPLVDGGFGTKEDFRRLGKTAKRAFVLVETQELLDLEGLFREYSEAAEMEKLALEADAYGVVYMSSRPQNLLYRHKAAQGLDNKLHLVIMEREAAKRASRLLRRGKNLNITVNIDAQLGGPYDSYNVIGEIKGSEIPDEIVVVGAHLDSWDLGTGALDNGCNVAMLIDIARQMKRLGLTPRRTIRFAFWNGEEQGMIGSWGYTKTHENELDKHVMAASFDIGSGRITGFFTNGREELLRAVERALKPVEGLGPFTHINEPVVGTDNLDFMLHGVGNLVANQASANYGPNYHARSDTYDKVDLHQLRLNAAIAAAVTYGFAQMEVDWHRQSRAEIDELVRDTSLGQQLKTFGFWKAWAEGSRGRRSAN